MSLPQGPPAPHRTHREAAGADRRAAAIEQQRAMHLPRLWRHGPTARLDRCVPRARACRPKGMPKGMPKGGGGGPPEAAAARKGGGGRWRGGAEAACRRPAAASHTGSPRGARRLREGGWRHRALPHRRRHSMRHRGLLTAPLTIHPALQRRGGSRRRRLHELLAPPRPEAPRWGGGGCPVARRHCERAGGGGRASARHGARGLLGPMRQLSGGGGDRHTAVPTTARTTAARTTAARTTAAERRDADGRRPRQRCGGRHAVAAVVVAEAMARWRDNGREEAVEHAALGRGCGAALWVRCRCPTATSASARRSSILAHQPCARLLELIVCAVARDVCAV